jgi:hypothetical protein
VQNSGATLSAKVPAGAAGAVDVSVTTPAGTATRAGGLTYTAAPIPIVSSITPNFGPASGGTNVIIRGTGFTGTTSVTIQGGSPSFVVDNDTQISLTTAPAASGGPASVVITTPGGSVSTPFTYAVSGFPAPTVSSI